MVVNIKALSVSASASSLGDIHSKRWVNELRCNMFAISPIGNRFVIVLRNFIDSVISYRSLGVILTDNPDYVLVVLNK